MHADVYIHPESEMGLSMQFSLGTSLSFKLYSELILILFLTSESSTHFFKNSKSARLWIFYLCQVQEC